MEATKKIVSMCGQEFLLGLEYLDEEMTVFVGALGVNSDIAAQFIVQEAMDPFLTNGEFTIMPGKNHTTVTTGLGYALEPHWLFGINYSVKRVEKLLKSYNP